jgi:thioredoxin reductase (NADPH)
MLDNKGFVETGSDLSPEDLTAAHWPLTRRPYLLESSLPGIFAAGDVRGGNMPADLQTPNICDAVRFSHC